MDSDLGRVLLEIFRFSIKLNLIVVYDHEDENWRNEVEIIPEISPVIPEI